MRVEWGSKYKYLTGYDYADIFGQVYPWAGLFCGLWLIGKGGAAAVLGVPLAALGVWGFVAFWREQSRKERDQDECLGTSGDDR